jgi:hypothetical protein
LTVLLLSFGVCVQVLDGDFFLVAAKDAFMEAARQFLFENYCRLHQVGCDDGWGGCGGDKG